jgi:DNA-binding CsgD family transcriptional regulator
MSRYVVLEKPDARTSIDEIATELSAGSARVIAGWHPPPAGSEVVCIGRVATAADASAAVLCAVAGARLVVDAVADREVIDRLCDDLRRLGEPDQGGRGLAGPGLDLEERQLLALLLGGATLGQAAQALHISRRTADRRLAAARTRLGARSTSEAVAAAARAGVKPVQPRQTAR